MEHARIIVPWLPFGNKQLQPEADQQNHLSLMMQLALILFVVELVSAGGYELFIQMGFVQVTSGPLVRNSHHAEDVANDFRLG